MEERLLTRHHDPAKQGVNISKAKHEAVRQAIVDTLQTALELLCAI